MAREDAELEPETFVIESLGGMCPVQGYGRLDGRIWYFRARGEAWRFEVWAPGVTWRHGDWGLPDEASIFDVRAPWGDASFEAGHMPVDEAERLIRESAQKFLLYLAAGKIL